MNSRNSWVLSVKNPTNTKYQHHFFCRCGREFMFQTEIDNPDAPDILCPRCGNDYFKDTLAFKKMTTTRIWKYFDWESVVSEDESSWSVLLKYRAPSYKQTMKSVILEDEDLLSIRLRKDGYLAAEINFKSILVQKYSLFLDDRVQTFKELLLQDAKLNLYNFIISKKSEYQALLGEMANNILSADEKLKSIKQLQMLDFTLKLRHEKSVKKALYQAYKNSLKNIGYYPYSDYIFSRTIENTDLIVKLYGIYPAIKQHLFSDETFEVGVEFILFLKRHYSEKQIVKLFVEDIQDAQEYKTRVLYWRDTLRMLYGVDAFISLEEHFTKVKLSAKKLHDEIIRVFHIVSYELDAKEVFEYSDIYLSACGLHEDLEFRLPLTVNELSVWAKTLHNCMFGYTRRIHQKQSIIYGVFRANELLYAVELNGFRIVQAKAVFNACVPEGDMRVVDGWKNGLSKN